MFKKVKELKLKVKIAVIAVAIIFVSSFVLSIYSVVRIHTLKIEFDRQLFSFYDEFYQWKVSEGSYKLDSVDDVLLHLKENLALELSLPDGVTYVSALADLNKYEKDLNNYTIVVDLNNTDFNEFGNHLYDILYDLVSFKELGVQSFKEEPGYYTIKCFEDATYNNMYFDVDDILIDESADENASFRNKMKLQYNKADNQVTILINHW